MHPRLSAGIWTVWLVSADAATRAAALAAQPAHTPLRKHLRALLLEFSSVHLWCCHNWHRLLAAYLQLSSVLYDAGVPYSQVIGLFHACLLPHLWPWLTVGSLEDALMREGEMNVACVAS